MNEQVALVIEMRGSEVVNTIKVRPSIHLLQYEAIN